MSRQERIEQALREKFEPTHLEVTNDSHRHSVAEGSETHFTILLVSAQFEGLTRVERHRRVHTALTAELDAGLHALAVRALAPSEYDGASTFAAPDCLGGSKALRGKHVEPAAADDEVATSREVEAIDE